MSNGFQDIYPFTTETSGGYITKMDIENKKVLTVGSSCDQALNSLLMGASEVTVFDINEKIKQFYELKKELILTTSRINLVDRVVNDNTFSYSSDIFTQNQLEKMNLYLSNDENYNKLRKIIKTKKLNFITGDIFNIGKSLDDYKYDRVILSNVLQYIPDNKNVYEIYSELSKHLNNDALIQLYYLYGSIYPKGFSKVVNQFLDNDIILKLESCDDTDSIVSVKSNIK